MINVELLEETPMVLGIHKAHAYTRDGELNSFPTGWRLALQCEIHRPRQCEHSRGMLAHRRYARIKKLNKQPRPIKFSRIAGEMMVGQNNWVA